MPYRTCYYQRDFYGITLEKKHPCTGIGSRFSSCSALDNSTRFLMAIEVEKTRSFQQFRTLQGPLLAHQFGEVRMQRPNLVYPRHQAVQVLLAPRTPAATLGGFRELLCFTGKYGCRAQIFSTQGHNLFKSFLFCDVICDGVTLLTRDGDKKGH